MTKHVPCADCGTPRPVSRSSLPEGQMRCHDCRRARPVLKAHKIKRPTVPCADCGELRHFSTTSLPAGQLRCNDCRRANPTAPKERPTSRPLSAIKASTTERGYGYEHRRLRRHLIATFVDGTPCARCERPMYSTDAMDLDHSDDRGRYLGLSHATCNRAGRPVERTTFDTHDCPICGTPGVRARQKTCSRACGVEWKRMAA